MVEVIIDSNSDISGELETLMLEAAQIALAKCDFDHNCEIDIKLTDEDEIKLINKEYRGIDLPTDVLSFPLWEEGEFDIPKDEFVLLGQVVICDVIAARQAIEYGHPYSREMAYLTVHAILHLLGYDHLEENEKSEMRVKEEEILADLSQLR